MSNDLKADLAKFLMEGDVFWTAGIEAYITVSILHDLGLIESVHDDAGWRIGCIGCRVTEAGKRYIAGGD